MDPREELMALRRMAELEAKASGQMAAPSEIPGKRKKQGLLDILTLPFEMGLSLSQKPRAEQAAFIAPTVEALGTVGGAALGTGAGPLGTVAGAGAGYAGAQELMRYVAGNAAPETLRQATERVGKTALTGATMEAGGRAAAPYIAKSVEYLVPKMAGAVSGAKDILMPSGLKSSGLAAALNNDPALMAQVKTLLEQGKTIDQAAAITGSTGLATFAKTARDSSTATQMLYNELNDALKATQVNKLATAAQNVNALTQANLPIATASPTAPRRSVKQALASEAATLEGQKAAMTRQLTAEQKAAEAAVAAQRQGVESKIANVSQLETGRALAEANRAIEANTTATVTKPAYDAAFAAAPNPTIKLDNLASVAKGQLGDVLTQIKGLAPNASVLLEKYGPKQVESMVQGYPIKTMQAAKPVTLEEANAIRQAINIDLSSLKGSQESGANIARARLMELKSALDSSIAKDVPQKALNLFENANKLFKERIVDVHRTGQPANLGRTSTLNEPMLRPGDIVSKAMADEGSTLQFLKVFKQDPAAMQNLKTGVEDLYRQQVLAGGKAATPEAHAKFMFDNAKQLGALDSAGLGMTTRLNQIGGQVKALTAAEEALAAQGKTIPSKVAEKFKAEDEALNLASTTLGFKQTDKLRSAIVTNPEVAGQALSRMDAPAKSSLARGVMQDAGKASDPLQHLIDNERGIMRVLNAHDPKTAQATFDMAKKAAEVSKLIEETGNQLGVNPQANAMVTKQNLNRMTQGLPEVRAVVEEIQTQLAQGKKFEELAAQGAQSKTSALKLFREQTTQHMFPLNKVWSIANAVLGRLEGRIDAKLAVEIANELSNSTSAIAAVSKAQAKQAQKLAVTEAGKKAADVVRKIPPGAAINALAPNAKSQNALAESP